MENVKPMVMVIFPPAVKEFYSADFAVGLEPPHGNNTLRKELRTIFTVSTIHVGVGEPVLEVHSSAKNPLDRNKVLSEMKAQCTRHGYELKRLPVEPTAR